MQERRIYSFQDCAETGYDCCLKDKVVILDNAFADAEPGQLYFCLCGNGAGSNPKGSALFLISLQTGQFQLKSRREVLGVLKRELLPDAARERLALIRPVGARNVSLHTPKYSSCCYQKDGRPFPGASLCTEQEVIDYIRMQAPYQHRVAVFDRHSGCVLEMFKGTFLPPMQSVRKGVELIWQERTC